VEAAGARTAGKSEEMQIVPSEIISVLKTYPNPVENYMLLEPGNINISKIELFDLDGRWVRNYHKDTRSLDFNGIHQGVYLLKVTSTRKVDILRVVKK
jgi:hypothetical protein